MGDLSLYSNPKGKKDLGLIVPVISPKGGTGKTFLAVNLGVLLKSLGHRVLVYDAHPTFPQVRILAHSEPPPLITDFLEGKTSFDKLIQRGSGGLDVLYAEWGPFNPLPTQEVFPQIHRNLGRLLEDYDYILIDTPAGDPQDQKIYWEQGDRVILVLQPDLLSTAYTPTFLQRAAALNPKVHIDLVVNRAFTPNLAVETYKRLTQSLEKIKGAPKVQFLGYILDDSKRAWESVQKRTPLALLDQGGNLTGCFHLLAEQFLKSYRPRGRRAFVENFLRQRGT